MRSSSGWSRTRSMSVNQLVSTKQGLLALTSNNIFSVQGSNEDFIAATPPPRVRPEISRGVSLLNPVTIDNVIFYETAKLSSVRTIGYEFEIDGIKTDDLTVFSPAPLREPRDRRLGVRREAASASGSCAATASAVPDVGAGAAGLGLDALRDGRQLQGVCTITEQGEDRAYFVERGRSAAREALHRAHGVRAMGGPEPTPATSIAPAPSSMTPRSARSTGSTISKAGRCLGLRRWLRRHRPHRDGWPR
jgi:hypothetical protein